MRGANWLSVLSQETASRQSEVTIIDGDKLLVIRSRAKVKPHILARLAQNIRVQKETGVVVVPDWCEVIVRSANTEIRIEDKEGNYAYLDG